jgi:hypothetical protein
MAKKIRVWDGSAWQDVAPALPYTAVHSAQASMPSTAVDGQIWLDTDASVPSTSVTRWYKLPSAGTTTLSGNDDNSIPLAYTPGYEQVFLNGTLLSRSAADYTATTGTSVVLSSAIVAGDIVEIICPLQITTTDTYTQSATDNKFVQNTGYFAAAKNYISNGAFDIWQRGTSVTAGNNIYTADRWSTYTDSQTRTVSRQPTGDLTNLPNIQYCARMQRPASDTGTGRLIIGSGLETANSIPLVSKTATLSFYARAGTNFSSSGNGLFAYLQYGTGTDQNVFVGFTGHTNLAAESKTLTTTWQRFSITGTFPTNANQIGYQFGYTPTGTAGANDYFEITGVQLEQGSAATPFIRSTGNIGGELAACQRYFEILDTTNQNDWIGDYYNTTTCYAPIFWKVTKRVAPTLTLPAASSFIVWNAGAGNTPSAVGTDTLLTNGGSIYGVTSARTAGSAGRLRLSSNTISVSAEL